MRGNFQPSLKRLDVSEGGYVNNRHDNGGPTNRGVTQRVYNGYRTARRLPTRSVRNITQDEVESIYKQQYWDAAKCDVLPPGIDYVQFDGAVNSGPGQATKWLQRALNEMGAKPPLKIDGGVGNATLGAVAKLGLDEHDELVDRICDRRMAFLKQHEDWPHFKNGWTTRVAEVRRVGLAWAGVAQVEPVLSTPSDTPIEVPFDVVPSPEFVERADAPAMIDRAVKRPTKGIADALTGAGGTLAGLPIVLKEATDQLNPLSAASAFASTALVYVTVAGVVVAVVGIAYRVYQKRREEERADALDLPTRRVSA